MSHIRRLHDAKPTIRPRNHTRIVKGEIKRETVWKDSHGNEYIPSGINKFELKYPRSSNSFSWPFHPMNHAQMDSLNNSMAGDKGLLFPNPELEGWWFILTMILMVWSFFMFALGCYLTHRQHQKQMQMQLQVPTQENVNVIGAGNRVAA